MNKKIHSIKIFFLKIKWYFDLINYARNHATEVDNYRFLLETKKIAKQRYLEIERKETNVDKVNKLKAQIEIIDKILNYVHK